jgi:hypothetical protein
MMDLMLLVLLVVAPLAVGLAVALPRRGLPRRELDLEAVVDVVDHGAGARHGLHRRRVPDLEALLQVAADGVAAVGVVVGGLPPGEPAAAEPPHDAGGHGQEGDHREHGEDRAERTPGRRGGGRVRAQDGVGRGGGVVHRGVRQRSHVLPSLETLSSLSSSLATLLSLKATVAPLLTLSKQWSGRLGVSWALRECGPFMMEPSHLPSKGCGF